MEVALVTPEVPKVRPVSWGSLMRRISLMLRRDWKLTELSRFRPLSSKAPPTDSRVVLEMPTS